MSDDTQKQPEQKPLHNAAFGLPPVTETSDQRLIRLQKQAEALIAQETDAEVVERMVAEARAKRAAAELPQDTDGFPKEYVRVVIFKGSQKFDLSYVPLGINGFVIKCPRGEEVILPKCFVTECLEHAIEEVTVQSQGGLITRPAHRFPYSLKGPATPEEYKAFQDQQRELHSRQTMAAA